MQLMQTKEFQTSPAAQMKALLGDFLNSSGYYSIFLPNLRILSESYRTYIGQLEQANAVFLQWMEEQKLSSDGQNREKEEKECRKKEINLFRKP